MANQPSASPSQQSQQPPSSQHSDKSAPRVVNFVVDRELTVQAEVIREHQDGSLDLRGRFGQPNKHWEDKESVNEVTGEKQIFAEETSVPDPRVAVRLRVRQADEGEVRAGRMTPGTWFEIEK